MNQDHHNQGGLFALLGSMAFVFVFFFYIVFINKGPDLDEKVSDPAPVGAPKFDLASVKEPWLPNEQVALAGQKLFKQNCAMCHGEKGDLVGGVPTARNLIDGQWKMGAGFIAHFKVLQNGIPGTQMASVKATMKPAERWAVLNWVNTITKNKSTDKPEDIAAFAATAD
jgi:mono/diheme cytochrome c family protein